MLVSCAADAPKATSASPGAPAPPATAASAVAPATGATTAHGGAVPVGTVAPAAAPVGAAAPASAPSSAAGAASAPTAAAAAAASAPAPAPGAPASAAVAGLPPGTLQRAAARWVPVEWSALSGWSGDRTAEVWPALLRGCEKPAPGWARVCAAARTLPVPVDDARARAFLEEQLRPYRIEAHDGTAVGMITGYVEARIAAQRAPSRHVRVPLYAPPADLASRQPYWTRKELDTLPAARRALRGRALGYVADPLDALFLQIQGSGRVWMREADGRRRLVRLTYAAHNGHAYKSVGKWLIEQGELRADRASWPDIKDWAQRNPTRVKELLWSNPRVVFFREEPVVDPELAPVGGQGVPLTPRRSIAVDVQSVPYGTPVWIDTTEPLSNTPLRRTVMAQDTGSAIVGAVRADFFWGWGGEADAQAGRMKQPLRMWALWPAQAPAP